MLDVHPPEHTPHSWRDFFIHITTIVIGLLIAIGLEQTVEAIHHHHQRQRLLEDIRGEGASNAEICSNTLAAGKAKDDVYAAMAEAVRTAQVVGGGVTVVIPPAVRQKEALFVKAVGRIHGAILPTIPVWESARDTQATALLPPESDRFFADLPYDLNWIDFFTRNVNDAEANYDSLIRTLTGQPPPILAPAQNTLALTLGQRDRLLDSISRVQDASDSVTAQIRFFQRESTAVADGVQDDKQYKQWAASHPRH